MQRRVCSVRATFWAMNFSSGKGAWRTQNSLGNAQSARGSVYQFCRARNWSSLKERGRVKGGVFRSWRLDWACVDGVSCFPDSCHVRGERPVGSRTGRSPAAGGGAGGVLEVTGWEPDDLAAGERGGGGRAGRGRGAWGGSASEGGQAGSIRWAPAPPGHGGGAD